MIKHYYGIYLWLVCPNKCKDKLFTFRYGYDREDTVDERGMIPESYRVHLPDRLRFANPDRFDEIVNSWELYCSECSKKPMVFYEYIKGLDSDETIFPSPIPHDLDRMEKEAERKLKKKVREKIKEKERLARAVNRRKKDSII